MKRMHVHVAVKDLPESIRFYSALFAAQPGVVKDDFAELEEIHARLARADVSTMVQKGASCCYAKSDKYWTIDPQGIAWESFHSLGAVPVFGEDTAARSAAQKTACCAPALS
jgi:hypothetical protein